MVITAFDQVSREWLAACLRRNHGLVTGDLASFDMRVSQSVNAHTANLVLHYTDGATGVLPARLFLKLCAGPDFDRSEVDYYTRDYLSLADTPFPHCYDGEFQAEPRAYHLLLDDVSETHIDNKFREPTPAYGLALVEAFARLHAHLWQDERFVPLGYMRPSSAVIERYISMVRPGLEPMVRELGDELPTDWLRALHSVLDHHPQLMAQRAKNPLGHTVIHGDANPTNILSPKTGDVTPLYLIDRQPFDWSLTTWLAVSDLTYATVHWWPSETRRACEMPMLRTYHQALEARGVRGYTFDQLLLDYKLCAVQSLYVPLGWCAELADPASLKELWWAQLQRAMTAFFDLECDRLWS